MADLGGVGALVTGAGRGLGRGLALALAQRGAAVAVLDLDKVAARETLSQIEQAGGSGLAAQLDVTDEQQTETVIAAAARQFGGADLLVNNAGILTTAAVVEMSLSDWERVLRVNLTGVFLTARAFARDLTAAGRAGSIINIASIAGRRGNRLLAHYAASKFGVLGFTQSLAMELADADITVNAICPGVVETPMINELAQGWGQEITEMVSQQLVQRPQRPDEIAQAVAFLHRCRSVTGQAINVDGGTVFN